MAEFITGVMSIDTFMMVAVIGVVASAILLCAALDAGDGPAAGFFAVIALIIVAAGVATPSWREWRVMTYERAVARLSNERANCISEGRTDMYCSAHLVKYIADSTKAWDEIRKSGLDTLLRNK